MDPRPEPAAKKPPSAAAIAGLRAAAAELDVEEILDLCFAFSADPIRLTVYLDVLRGKFGQQAQAAACLVCFDLARQGETRFEPEFLALIPVVDEFAQSEAGGVSPMAGLINNNPYLTQLWSDLKERLEVVDRRVDDDVADAIDLDDDIVVLNLLDDDDILDIEDALSILPEGDDEMRLQWDDAMARFFDLDRGMEQMYSIGGHAVSMGGGFSAESKADITRIEALRDDAVSLEDHVPEAREMLPFVHLFLAAHQRSRNIFGRRSKRRDQAVRAGLAAFTALDAPPPNAVPWLVPPTAPVHGWDKVAELLLDYVAFLGTEPGLGEAMRDAGEPMADHLAEAYIESKRSQPPAPVLAEPSTRRRR